jgi:hypothetical protein
MAYIPISYYASFFLPAIFDNFAKFPEKSMDHIWPVSLIFITMGQFYGDELLDL